MISGGFDLAALFHALDAQRAARGLTWAQALREISRTGERRPGRHAIATSTVTSLRTKKVAEGDGVLQMLLWVNRTPESFVPGCELAGSDAAKLPEATPTQILRFDTGKLYAALNERRIERGMTWQQVAKEIGGVGAGSLTYLSKGSRVGFPGVMRITGWLGRPVAEFTRLVNR